MDTIAKSDAFFFITSICIVVLTSLVVLLCAYSWSIISDLKYIMKKARSSADEIVSDIDGFRESIKDKGKTIGALLSGFLAFRSKNRRRKKEGSN